jgi:hypothetical protein
VNDFGLADLSGIGDPGQLRARAEEAMAGLDVDSRPGASQQGADASDSVWVTVTTEGAVADISISRRWSERLADDRLGEAVLAAYRQAEQKRAVAETRDHRDAADQRYDLDMPDLDDPRWLDWVWATLSDSQRRVERLSARQPQETVQERTVAGPAGYVRLRVVDSTVTDVLVDAVHTARRDPDGIAGDLRAAFADVRRGGR